MNQGFGQLHFKLLHQGGEQGVVAAGLSPALGVVLEAGFQIAAQFGQGGFVAGLLGKGVVKGG